MRKDRKTSENLSAENTNRKDQAREDRRDFIRTGTVVSAAVAGLGSVPMVHAQETQGGNSDTVKLAMVGCGGRGGGGAGAALCDGRGRHAYRTADVYYGQGDAADG